VGAKNAEADAKADYESKLADAGAAEAATTKAYAKLSATAKAEFAASTEGGNFKASVSVEVLVRTEARVSAETPHC
jgi:hypothetical protein